MYKLTKDKNNHLLDNAVTAAYKKRNDRNRGYYKQRRHKVCKTR